MIPLRQVSHFHHSEILGNAAFRGSATSHDRVCAAFPFNPIHLVPISSPKCRYDSDMPAHHRDEANIRRKMGEDGAEAEALLAASLHDEDDVPTRSGPQRRAPSERRQSSITKPPTNGLPRTPRTSNRVRFDIAESETRDCRSNGHLPMNGFEREREPLDDEDDLSDHSPIGHRSSTGQRAPLLTGIEAPSVTFASTDVDSNLEDLLETARPKSGMRSAFMNMANSIMYDRP